MMEVSAINNNYNSAAFGAKIKFENPKHRKTMTNIANYNYAKEVLSRFEEYHPNDTVLIRLLTEKNKFDSCLEAENLTTGWKMRHRLTPDDAQKDFNDDSGKVYGGCKTLYNFLEDLLNKTYLSHGDFWGRSIAYKSEVPPSEHSVFEV